MYPESNRLQPVSNGFWGINLKSSYFSIYWCICSNPFALHDLFLTDSHDSIILRNFNVFLCLTVTYCTKIKAKPIVGDDRRISIPLSGDTSYETNNLQEPKRNLWRTRIVRSCKGWLILPIRDTSFLNITFVSVWYEKLIIINWIYLINCKGYVRVLVWKYTSKNKSHVINF